MWKSVLACVLTGLLCVAVVGCADDKGEEKKSVGKADDGHSDHGHHAHVHGPMGGELLDIPESDMKLEVVAKYGDNLIVFYLLDSDGKTAKKVKCEKLSGSFMAGEVKTMEVPAVDAEEGMASRFEVEDEGFAIARKTTGVKVEFEIDGKQHTVEVPKDPHG